ncbi:CD [Symbiodinium sp. CCMP2592]|nr:CD [Symbiodinium sp. CCMP2592]
MEAPSLLPNALCLGSGATAGDFDVEACEALESAGIKFRTFDSFLLYDIKQVKIDLGTYRGHFGTLTPFHSACFPAAALCTGHIGHLERLEPFQHYGTFGWTYQDAWALEENLISLVTATHLNSVKHDGYHGGHCSAVLCKPRWEDDELVELRVIGLGVNAPPRFEPGNPQKNPQSFGERSLRRLRSDKAFSKYSLLGRPRRGNEIHAEMQILSRCARAGISTSGGWMCIQTAPCWDCCKALIAAGISRVLFEAAPGQAQRLLRDDGLETLGFAEMPQKPDGTVLNWGIPILQSWDISESAALQILRRFLADGLRRYEASLFGSAGMAQSSLCDSGPQCFVPHRLPVDFGPGALLSSPVDFGPGAQAWHRARCVTPVRSALCHIACRSTSVPVHS